MKDGYEQGIQNLPVTKQGLGTSSVVEHLSTTWRPWFTLNTVKAK